jgi:hypothetical protein
VNIFINHCDTFHQKAVKQNTPCGALGILADFGKKIKPLCHLGGAGLLITIDLLDYCTLMNRDDFTDA